MIRRETRAELVSQQQRKNFIICLNLLRFLLFPCLTIYFIALYSFLGVVVVERKCIKKLNYRLFGRKFIVPYTLMRLLISFIRFLVPVFFLKLFSLFFFAAVSFFTRKQKFLQLFIELSNGFLFLRRKKTKLPHKLQLDDFFLLSTELNCKSLINFHVCTHLRRFMVFFFIQLRIEIQFDADLLNFFFNF